MSKERSRVRKFLEGDLSVDEFVNEQSNSKAINFVEEMVENTINSLEGSQIVTNESDIADNLVLTGWDVAEYFTVPESANRSDRTFVFLAKSRDLNIASLQTGQRFFSGKQENKLDLVIARVHEESGDLIGEQKRIVAPAHEEELQKEIQTLIESYVGFRT